MNFHIWILHKNFCSRSLRCPSDFDENCVCVCVCVCVYQSIMFCCVSALLYSRETLLYGSVGSQWVQQHGCLSSFSVSFSLWLGIGRGCTVHEGQKPWQTRENRRGATGMWISRNSGVSSAGWTRIFFLFFFPYEPLTGVLCLILFWFFSIHKGDWDYLARCCFIV